MTLNGVMTITLHYITEFGKAAFQVQHITASARNKKFAFAISPADELLLT